LPAYPKGGDDPGSLRLDTSSGTIIPVWLVPGRPWLEPKTPMKRYWSINGRFLAQPMTGVQRYAREIVRALDALVAEYPRELEVELLIPPGTEATLPLRNMAARPIGRLSGHLWEQVSLPSGVRGGLLSLCNTGPVALSRQIVCIHDMNTRIYPQSYTAAFRLLYWSLIPVLGRRAAAISTVSEYSAAELVRFGVCREDKLFVAPNGNEHVHRWTPKPVPRLSAFSAEDTIVLLGSRAPHKNIDLIIGMADRLALAGLRLAIVGGSDTRVFGAGRGGAVASNITWLGRLSDDELAALLGNCLCLAFPSLVEGFGLPPLEAMALGCPVIVSDRASLPEICGDAALYASPDDADAWVGRFMELATNPALRQPMIARGLAAVDRFSWLSSAERYLEAMATMDGVPYSPTGKGAPQPDAPVEWRAGSAPIPSIETISSR
jgi:glycosyltransferase involved in cell wall biosynthesis